MSIDDTHDKRLEDAADLRDDGESPVPGLDWQTFRNYAFRALTGDDTVPSSVLNCVNAALERGEQGLERKSRTWWRDAFWHHTIAERLNRINAGIGELEGMAAWYREQAAKMREEMDKIAERMGERGAFIDEADSIIDDWEQNGKLDRERALDALRKRGVDTNDRMSDAQILALLREDQRRALEEQSRDSDRYGHLDRWQQEFDRQAEELEEKAQDYKEERDRIMDDYGPNLTEEQREERQRRLDELEERVGENVVHAAQKVEDNKQAREASRNESEVNRDAAQVVDRPDAFAAFKDTFNTKSAGEETQVALSRDQEPPPGADVPAAPGVNG